MMEYTARATFPVKVKANWEHHLYCIAVALSGTAIIYLLSVIVIGNAWIPHIKTDCSPEQLRLSLIQCTLGLVVMHLPALIAKLTRIKMPGALCAAFYIFVPCATVLGEVCSLYYLIPQWDSILHFGSGIMAGMLGSLLMVSFLKSKNCDQLVTPAFIATVTVCFALCVGVGWEIYEFAGDCLLDMNMQKALLQDGTALIGKAALADTMTDLVVDLGGALVAAYIAHFGIKHQKAWLFEGLIPKVHPMRKMQSRIGNIQPMQRND